MIVRAAHVNTQVFARILLTTILVTVRTRASMVATARRTSTSAPLRPPASMAAVTTRWEITSVTVTTPSVARTVPGKTRVYRMPHCARTKAGASQRVIQTQDTSVCALQAGRGSTVILSRLKVKNWP